MIPDCNKLVDHITAELRKHMDIGVVGLSGGADSSLVAVLLCRALGPANVIGISMPYNETDRSTYNARSTRLATCLGIRHHICEVTPIADAIDHHCASACEGDLSVTNRGNARSRARMCILYAVAHDSADRREGQRVRVVGTGNLSEDYIGYDTKGGDALADIFPIGELFKSEVYQLLDWFCAQGTLSEDLIDRVPTAGLEDNQTDEDDLGHSYAEMEAGIRYCLEHADNVDAHLADLGEVTRFVWERHQAHKHKHMATPVISARGLCE